MHTNLINGEWVDASEAQELRNPSDLDEVVGVYAIGNREHADTAISAARHAARGWARSGIQLRCDALDTIGTELLVRREELGALLSREEGKTLAEGIGEFTRAGHIFKFHAQQALRAQGELVPSVRPGLHVEVTREPVGVAGLITPWNFPVAIPAWKIAPALACGNTVVFKPAEFAPASAWALAEIIHRSGLPAGVFNLVMGRGQEVGRAIAEDPRVNALSFTGSAATGQRLAVTAAHQLKRVQLEMGGKNPLVVLDDADLQQAVDCAVQSAFFSTGQRCTAASRLIVTAGIYARFRDALLERTRSLRVGHALVKTTQIGPVANAAQLDTNLRYLDIGRQEGASLACGGDRPTLPTRGHYLSPAVFVDCDNAMRICQEEIFGPVAALIHARDAEHALELANATAFGLSAGVCTSSLHLAQHFKRELRAGMVMVNAPTAGVDYHVPFGGTLGSSFGPREQGTHAREFFTQTKTTYVNA
ncbi:MAG: aldehyde dehydrogenase family protein [Rhizobacter sp.]|nr:aldehyde dehydrogenase family protein [Rhizobacter sp.]